MTLWNLSENESANIDAFGDLMDSRYQTRLRELGFDSSSSILCLKAAPFNGPKVYQIGDSVFSLTEDIASHVLVSRK